MKTALLVRPTIISLIGPAFIAQYEVREYLRYSTSQYWPLKFWFYYGLGFLFVILAFIVGVRLWKQNKTVLSGVPLLLLLIGLLAVYAIRAKQKELDFSDVIVKGGLYFDSRRGEIMDGVYKEASAWDGLGKGETCIKREFQNGVPTGKWMASHKGDLIHRGYYLEEDSLRQVLAAMTGSIRVDLDHWAEVDYWYISIELVNPEKVDAITLEGVHQAAANVLSPKYEFHSVRNQVINEGF